jgi:hypothetical protein
MAYRTQLDLGEHVARIDRAITETAKYAVEQRRLGAQAEKYAEKYERNLCLMVVIPMVTGAASFGAVAAFMKLLIG